MSLENRKEKCVFPAQVSAAFLSTFLGIECDFLNEVGRMQARFLRRCG
jgi:hypothetical protein